MRECLCMVVSHHAPETLATPVRLDQARGAVEVAAAPATRVAVDAHRSEDRRTGPLAHEEFSAISEQRETGHQLATGGHQQAVRVLELGDALSQPQQQGLDGLTPPLRGGRGRAGVKRSGF